MVFRIEKDSYDLPVYSQIMKGYEALFEDICAGRIISAYAVEGHGICEAVSKMAFGNRMGIRIGHNVDPGDFFKAGWGMWYVKFRKESLGNWQYPILSSVKSRIGVCLNTAVQPLP